MAMNDNSEKKPLGERIRDFINPALADPRRQQIELDILDSIFDQLSMRVPAMIEKSFTPVFNEAARMKEEDRNPFIITYLTQIDPQSGEPLYSPAKRFSIPICVNYANFSAQDIKELPGYIRFHEMARAEDISIRIIGLTADEAKNPTGVAQLPTLVIDASKDYNSGAVENSNLYPNLPPPKVEFDRKKPKDFNF